MGERRWLNWVFVVLSLVLVTSCAGRKDVNRKGEIKLRGEKPVKMKGKRPGDLLQKGVASWYGHPYHGRKTSNGETYDMDHMTAAHKTIPFDTLVKVVDRDSGRHVYVRINDRGPFVRGRIIDLSREAARQLGIQNKGTTRVALYLAEPKQIKRDRKQAKKEARRNKRNKPAPVKKPTPPPVEEVTDVVYAPDEVIEEEIIEPVVVDDGVEVAPPSVSGWTIQVGSFGDPERARAMQARMKRYHSHVQIVEKEGMYRVRVGLFESRDSAEKLAERMRDDEIPVWILRSP